MDTAGILGLYDRHERRLARAPGLVREETPLLARLYDPAGSEATVTWSRLSDADAEEAIRGEIARFGELGMPFEWKLYSHDLPADLGERLVALGFEAGDEEAIMALELAAYDPPPRGGEAEIRRIRDAAGLADVAAVKRAVWGEGFEDLEERLGRLLREAPDYLSVYVAYLGGRPVSSAWINFPPDSPFASLWGGSTLAEHRGKGIYSALLDARAAEARRRGYAFLTIDALPSSRPIAERRGFKLLATSRPCSFDPRTQGPRRRPRED